MIYKIDLPQKLFKKDIKSEVRVFGNQKYNEIIFVWIEEKEIHRLRFVLKSSKNFKQIKEHLDYITKNINYFLFKEILPARYCMMYDNEVVDFIYSYQIMKNPNYQQEYESNFDYWENCHS